MTNKVSNAMFRYFETLYDLNRNLIILCGVDVVDDGEHYKKPLEEIIHAIPRLIPYAATKGSAKYEININDGLLEFSDDLPFLKSEYDSILQRHYCLLEKIKKIRNKFEHRMHGASIIASGSGSAHLFDVTYKVSDEEFNLSAGEFISLAENLNNIFFKIQEEVGRFAWQQSADYHPYYRRLTRYGFVDFNRIYKSDLLRIIGKALRPF